MKNGISKTPKSTKYANRLYSVVLTWKSDQRSCGFSRTRSVQLYCLFETYKLLFSMVKKERTNIYRKAFTIRSPNFIREYFLTSFIFHFFFVMKENSCAHINSMIHDRLKLLWLQFSWIIEYKIHFVFIDYCVHFHLPSYCIRSKIHQTKENSKTY